MPHSRSTLRRARFARAATALALALAIPAGPARAEPTGTIAVTLTGPTAVVPEVPVTYAGTVTLAGTAPLPRQNVRIMVDGALAAGDTTDETGGYDASFAMTEGTHTLQAMIHEGTPLETRSAPLTVVVAHTADVELSMVAPDALPPLSTVEVDVTVVNRGPSRASTVIMQAQVDGDAAILEAHTSLGRECPVEPRVQCNLAHLDPNRAIVVTLVIGIGFPGAVELDAWVVSATSDPNPDNNAARATIAVA